MQAPAAQKKSCLFQANGDFVCQLNNGKPLMPPAQERPTFEECNTFMRKGVILKQQMNDEIFNYQISQNSYVCTDHAIGSLLQ